MLIRLRHVISLISLAGIAATPLNYSFGQDLGTLSPDTADLIFSQLPDAESFVALARTNRSNYAFAKSNRGARIYWKLWLKSNPATEIIEDHKYKRIRDLFNQLKNNFPAFHAIGQGQMHLITDIGSERGAGVFDDFRRIPDDSEEIERKRVPSFVLSDVSSVHMSFKHAIGWMGRNRVWNPGFCEKLGARMATLDELRALRSAVRPGGVFNFDLLHKMKMGQFWSSALLPDFRWYEAFSFTGFLGELDYRPAPGGIRNLPFRKTPTALDPRIEPVDQRTLLPVRCVLVP